MNLFGSCKLSEILNRRFCVGSRSGFFSAVSTKIFLFPLICYCGAPLPSFFAKTNSFNARSIIFVRMFISLIFCSISSPKIFPFIIASIHILMIDFFWKFSNHPHKYKSVGVYLPVINAYCNISFFVASGNFASISCIPFLRRIFSLSPDKNTSLWIIIQKFFQIELRKLWRLFYNIFSHSGFPPLLVRVCRAVRTLVQARFLYYYSPMVAIW